MRRAEIPEQAIRLRGLATSHLEFALLVFVRETWRTIRHTCHTHTGQQAAARRKRENTIESKALNLESNKESVRFAGPLHRHGVSQQNSGIIMPTWARPPLPSSLLTAPREHLAEHTLFSCETAIGSPCRSITITSCPASIWHLPSRYQFAPPVEVCVRCLTAVFDGCWRRSDSLCMQLGMNVASSSAGGLTASASEQPPHASSVVPERAREIGR